MASIGKLPIYMRIGDGAECEVGTIELDLVGGQITAEANLAGLLRAAADRMANTNGPGLISCAAEE